MMKSLFQSGTAGGLPKLNSNLSTLSDKVSGIEVRIVDVPLPSTFASGATYNTNLKTIIDADLPSGKKCIGIVGYDSAGASILLSQIRYVNNSYSFNCINTASYSYSDKTAHVSYLCIKS